MSEIALEREEALICIPAGTEKLCCAVERMFTAWCGDEDFFLPGARNAADKKKKFSRGGVALAFYKS